MKVDKNQIRFIVDIVDHCNLNCKGCGHFSPLAPKSFLDIETFENDLRRLNELLNGNIYCFELMGGEALLHPQLEDFIEITAQYVSGMKHLCTNGVLLPKLPDRIYQLCAQTGTTICVTMYPIHIDWNEINRKANLYGTKLYQIKTVGESEKKWFKNPRDKNGNRNVEDGIHQLAEEVDGGRGNDDAAENRHDVEEGGDNQLKGFVGGGAVQAVQLQIERVVVGSFVDADKLQGMDAEAGPEEEIHQTEYQQPAAAEGGEVAYRIGTGGHTAAHLGAEHHRGQTEPDAEGFHKLR